MLEQSANPIAADLARRMKPAKQTHPTKAFGQDVLEKAADQFGGLQRNSCGLAGVGVAVRPNHFSRGKDLQTTVAGGGFENVSGEVSQSVFTRTGSGAVDTPLLFPDFGR